MQKEESIYQGIVWQKLFKKPWMEKYCMLFKASKFGTERLELYDSQDSKEPSKLIPLENCIRVHAKSVMTFVVTIESNDATTNIYEFSTASEYDTIKWLTALIQSVAFSDEVSKITSIQKSICSFCSLGETVFNVKLHPSAMSTRCGLKSKNYELVVTQTALQLRNIMDFKLLYYWPYLYIRQYGYGKFFTFEAGRKCESGEGTFYLEHPNNKVIFWCLASKIKSLKKLLFGNASCPVYECEYDQLHDEVTMEARRTLLPPSASPKKNSLSSLSDTISNEIPSIELEQSKPLVLIKPEFKPKPVQKLKPVKAPRKFLPVTKSITESDSIDDSKASSTELDQSKLIVLRKQVEILKPAKRPEKFLPVSNSTTESKSSCAVQKPTSTELAQSKPLVPKKPEVKPKPVQKLKPTTPPVNFLPVTKSTTESESSYVSVQKPTSIELEQSKPLVPKKPEIKPKKFQKLKPTKPHGKSTIESESSYVSVQKYDQIEHRLNTRQTNGINATSFIEYQENLFADKPDERGYKKTEDNVSHEFYNEEAYAVICKPK